MLRLKALREEKKVSQQKLALELNVSQASISKYEKGLAEPDIPMLCTMAEYFHVSVDYLLGQVEQKNYLNAGPEEERERELLLKFRRLSLCQKERAEAYILGLLDA